MKSVDKLGTLQPAVKIAVHIKSAQQQIFLYFIPNLRYFRKERMPRGR
jgi:hypothetical protein